MAEDESQETTENTVQDTGQDTMFQDAVNALREGNKSRAREILTRLLKTDQNNATYWVWMSAAVDTSKERVYCLQTALKLDPESVSAKRGLTLLGAIPPDENVQPFPLNHPRAWEEKLIAEQKQSRSAGASNPILRLALIIVAGIVILGLAVGVFFLPQQSNNPFFRVFDTNTPGPSPTFTATPTFVNETPQAITPTSGPISLAEALGISYTATPLYVNTPRAPQSADQYSVAMAAYQKGDWASYILNMQQIESLEPNAPDVPYDIGEAYRFQGNYKNALGAYTASLHIDPNFAPAYLGMARVDLAENPGQDVTSLLDTAIKDDPNYGEAYLERANYYLAHSQPDLALSDLATAVKLMPNSALVQLAYAQAYLAQGSIDQALAAAQKANQIDETLLPAYLALGQANVANSDCPDAIQPLKTYTKYDSSNASAYALLGQCYEQGGLYQEAVTATSKAISLDPTQRMAYLYRGLSYLELNNVSGAESDIRGNIGFFPNSFEANLGLLRISYLQEHYGDAFLRIPSLTTLAQTDQQKALVFYWTGLVQEKRGATKEAITAWKALLAMSSDVMTPQMHDDAVQHLDALTTVTPTTTAATLTSTPATTTGTLTSTSVITPTLASTPTPAATQTPTPTSTP